MQPLGDREIIIALAAASTMLLLLGGFIITFIFFYKKRRMAHAQEKQIMADHFQKEILKTQLEIQEQTLKTISQEIHDNIGQTLSLAKLNLNTLDLQKAEVAAQKISTSKELVGKVIQDLRSLSRSLQTDNILTSGLWKAIQTELDLMSRTGEFQTEFRINDLHARLDARKELIIFRIVQEALNNIIKHASASLITVVAKCDNDWLQLTVADNGKGFIVLDDAEPVQQGSGLKNMTNRAKLIGGRLEVQSNNMGTTVQITVPSEAT